MSQENFGSLYKRILVYAPECPLPLAQEFINNAYSRCQSSWAWQALREDYNFNAPLAYTSGTAVVTQGLTTVSGNVGVTWTSAMVGLQFMVGGNAPVYTIESVPTATSLTLDLPYIGTSSAAAAYSISMVYVDLPSDYIYIESIRDLANNWRLRTGFSQKQLDVWDAKRNVSGTPYLTAAAPVSTLGTNRLELWPRPLPGPKTYMMRYQKRTLLLSNDTDTPIFPIRGDAIRYGALAELSLWKGVSKAPNIYFDMNNHMLYENKFQEALQECIREENEHSQQMVKYEDSEGLPYAPIDASYLQTHDVF